MEKYNQSNNRISKKKNTMEMNRKIDEVIDKIIEQIPEGEYLNLINRLKSIKRSALYAPPEGMSYWWGFLSVLLNKELPVPPENEWQEKIYKIIRAE